MTTNVATTATTATPAKRPRGRPRKAKRGENTRLPDHKTLMLAWYGWDGSGKSLTATALIYEEYYKGDQHLLHDGTRGPIRVIHNGGLNFGERFDLHKFINMEYRDAFIFLDEAHEICDPRRAPSFMNVMVGYIPIQRRKLNLHIGLASHGPHLVDPRVREQVDFQIYCTKAPNKDEEGRVVYQAWQDDNGHFGPPGEFYQGIVMVDLDDYWHLYDTKNVFPIEDIRFDKNDAKMRKEYEQAQTVLKAAQVLYESDWEYASSLDIQRVLQANDVRISPQVIGKALKSLGYEPAKQINGRRSYLLSNFFEQESIDSEYRGMMTNNYENTVRVGDINNDMGPSSVQIPTGIDAEIDSVLSMLPEKASYSTLEKYWERRGLPLENMDVELRKRGFNVLMHMGRKVVTR